MSRTAVMLQSRFAVMLLAMVLAAPASLAAQDVQTVIVPLPPPAQLDPSPVHRQAATTSTATHAKTVRPRPHRSTYATAAAAKAMIARLAANDRPREGDRGNLAARGPDWRQEWRNGQFGWWRRIDGVWYYRPGPDAAPPAPGPQIASAAPLPSEPDLRFVAPPGYRPPGPRYFYPWPPGPMPPH
jgi:hypothetical protein